MIKKKVLLIQLPVPYLNWEMQKEDDPLATAYLKAYADQYQKSWEIKLLPENLRLYGADPVILKYIMEYSPEVVGFSLYCWNIQRSKHLVRKIKQGSSFIKIIAGGPEITADTVNTLDTELWDYVCIGEGEQTFLNFLDSYPDSLTGIGGLGINENNRFQLYSPKNLKIQQLDDIPNPYISGTLEVKDSFMMFETLRGCPYGCFFCYYGKDDRKIRAHSLSYLKNVLDFARNNKVKNIYLLDPAFNTHPDLEKLCTLLRQYDNSFSIHTELKVESLTPETISLLKGTGIKSAEIGLQTIGVKSRNLLNNPLDPERFQHNVRLLHDIGIKLFIDLIIGLPGDTEEDVKEGARYIKTHLLEEGDEVQVFHLSVLPGTMARNMAREWGLQYDPDPPYLITDSPTLPRKKMAHLLDWVQDFFSQYFDLPEYPYFFSRSCYPSQTPFDHKLNVLNRAIIKPAFWKSSKQQQYFFQQDFARHLTLEFINPVPFTGKIFNFMEELLNRLPHNVFKVIWHCRDFELNELEIFLHKWHIFQTKKTAETHYFQQYYRYFNFLPPKKFLLTYLLISAKRYFTLPAQELDQWYPCILLWDSPEKPDLPEKYRTLSLPVLVEDELFINSKLSRLDHYSQPVFFRNPERQLKWISTHEPENPYPPLWWEIVGIFPKDNGHAHSLLE